MMRGVALRVRFGSASVCVCLSVCRREVPPGPAQPITVAGRAPTAPLHTTRTALALHCTARTHCVALPAFLPPARVSPRPASHSLSRAYRQAGRPFIPSPVGAGSTPPISTPHGKGDRHWSGRLGRRQAIQARQSVCCAGRARYTVFCMLLEGGRGGTETDLAAVRACVRAS